MQAPCLSMCSPLFHTRWGSEKVLRFVDDYHHHEVLWNTRHAEYKNSRLKQQLLSRLADKYRCDVPSLKKKIKNIRTIFHREHRRLVTTSLGRATEAGPKWFAYDALLFILDADGPIVGHYTKGSETEESAGLMDSQDPLFIKQEDIDVVDVRPTGEPPTFTAAPSRPTLDERSPVKPKWNDAVLQTLRSQRDGCSTYGEHVANEIRKLRPTAQTMAKHLINNVLFNAAMGKYDNPSGATGLSSGFLEPLVDLPSVSCGRFSGTRSPPAAAAST